MYYNSDPTVKNKSYNIGEFGYEKGIFVVAAIHDGGNSISFGVPSGVDCTIEELTRYNPTNHLICIIVEVSNIKSNSTIIWSSTYARYVSFSFIGISYL